MKKSFDVMYYSNRLNEGRRFSHQYTEPWEKKDYYCPRCGKQEVWFRNDGGDYYVGEQHICTACKGGFHIPGGVNTATGEQDEQRLEHLIANNESNRLSATNATEGNKL